MFLCVSIVTSASVKLVSVYICKLNPAFEALVKLHIYNGCNRNNFHELKVDRSLVEPAIFFFFFLFFFYFFFLMLTVERLYFSCSHHRTGRD